MGIRGDLFSKPDAADGENHEKNKGAGQREIEAMCGHPASQQDRPCHKEHKGDAKDSRNDRYYKKSRRIAFGDFRMGSGVAPLRKSALQRGERNKRKRQHDHREKYGKAVATRHQDSFRKIHYSTFTAVI